MADDLTLEVPGPDGERAVRVSSPDRVLWPRTEAGPAITKGDLAAYVVAVGEPLLRHIGDRPVTLQRFPEGIEGEAFYSKNPPKGAPAWVRTVMCRYPSGRRHTQLVVDEIGTAVWAVQMNTITFHPWPCRAEDTDDPDELRIDLDPQPGRTFADAVEAAYALKEVMEGIGLTPYAKTSGNRGVHVFARIAPTREFLDVRHGVISIARELERRLPDLVTTAWWKEERGERVFVDFNQACRDRTIASAYSPRPIPGAPVSFPVTWAELREATSEEFTVLTVPEIVRDRGDAWADIDEHVGDVDGAITLWDKDVERGLGELNFPPDYPKMPGEPPRVQPSKRRSDKSDEDYLPPKAERDAAWNLPVPPPISPMLAKAVKDFPKADVIFEPKWDGFRSIVFRSGDEVEIGSRNERPMTRYFPELVEAIKENLPERCVVDGEIVLVRPDEPRLDFELLQLRLHPAASRVRKLAAETPASFVAFDLLALGDEDYTGRPFAERRAALERALAGVRPPIHLTPATRDRDVARRWFEQFEGAGLDGVVAKPVDGTYQQDKRVMWKIKHERTADCVVAGYRTHKSGDDAIGSLLLGLYTDDGQLHSVGVIGAFPMARRKELFEELQPLVTTFDGHPWAWAEAEQQTRTPTSGAYSRWNVGKDLSFTPLRPERVVEVRYDHMEGTRFRHTAQFVRWRPDREPRSCTFAQLEEPVSYDLADVLAPSDGTDSSEG
ncbi:DNA ligase [Nostocoides japonicum T1-X7]|uniref:DNA ligase (ATP) n=1 Tax=Nostocoides japonicum T1-X7 TaxID=1194083 RepID=A0A077LYG2_9MICO|nr:ATP-dependent DNA ligase [Tetrasphaera japonica]CCH77000.1 DNA ligase [Tetrasphaera japonica T1-X7]